MPTRCVADREIICTYSQFRRGFHGGITLGFAWGIRLDGHLPRSAEPQVIPGAGGSAGIPDSQARMAVTTSGAACVAAAVDRAEVVTGSTDVTLHGPSILLFNLLIFSFYFLCKIFPFGVSQCINLQMFTQWELGIFGKES